MKKKIIFCTSLVLIMIVSSLGIVFFNSGNPFLSVNVGAGESRRTYTEDDLKAAEKQYWEQIDSDYENNLQNSDNLLNDPSTNPDMNDDFKRVQACLAIFKDHTARAIKIGQENGKLSKDITVTELCHDKASYFKLLLDLCDIYTDSSIELTADDAVFIKYYILTVGGPAKLRDHAIESDPAKAETAVKEILELIDKTEQIWGEKMKDVAMWRNMTEDYKIKHE